MFNKMHEFLFKPVYVLKTGNKDDQRKKRGINMVEILLGLLVIGLIVVVVLNRYTAATKTNNINTFTQNMTLLSGNMKAFFANESAISADSLDASKLIGAGIVPRELQTAARDALRSPWGTIDMALTSVENGTDNAVEFTINSLDSEACAKIAQSMIAQDYYAVTPGSGGQILATDENSGKNAEILNGCQGDNLSITIIPFYL